MDLINIIHSDYSFLVPLVKCKDMLAQELPWTSKDIDDKAHMSKMKFITNIVMPRQGIGVDKSKCY